MLANQSTLGQIVKFFVMFCARIRAASAQPPGANAREE